MIFIEQFLSNLNESLGLCVSVNRPRVVYRSLFSSNPFRSFSHGPT